MKEIRRNLIGNGDFRSPECIEILKEADIVITNPPFSLFREYVAQLVEYNKKFIILGSQNAITYKEIFSLIKENKLWLGVKQSGGMEFRVPDYYPLNTTASRIGENKEKYIKVSVACWFTNLEHNKRNEELILFQKYNEKDYPKYDNYDAIEISKVKDIPINYDGVMGVPITFLYKHNPKQFKILGMSASAGYDKNIVGISFKGNKDARPLINYKNTYARIFIKRK